ncbi:MAG: hypothetical protein J6R34_00050 [Clostridia bacterium]|nr:hypothetical protein [Clostridia bacterium]MBO5776822.1 hypothetical protein [Clostridia bacterium]
MKKITSIVVAILLLMTMVMFTACNDKGDLRFVMPDGTPALAAMSLLGETTNLGGYNVSAEIVASTAIQTEIGGEKADIIIAPTNAGANLISKGANYKLVSVMVEGSLYLIGNPAKVGGNTTITLDDLKGKRIASIGQNNTPDKVFKYIIDKTEGVTYDDKNDIITFSDGQTATIEWCADGPAAKVALLRENNPCDFAIVGEPAATAFGTPNGGGFSARMDLQAMYKAVNGNDANFPQASLFVKTSLTKDKKFMSALLNALSENRDWVIANPSEVTATIQAKGSSTTFPAPSIPRCSIVVNKADNTATQEAIITYLSLMIPAVNWAEVDMFI